MRSVRQYGYRIVVIAATVILCSGMAVSSVSAQPINLPGYGGFTFPALQNPDHYTFDDLQLIEVSLVPLPQLQLVLDTLAPGLFMAEEAAPSAPVGRLYTTASYQVVRDDNPSGDSYSTLNIFTFARSTSSPGMILAVVLASYNDSEVPLIPGVMEADFEWEIENKKGETSVKYDIEGADGFKIEAFFVTGTQVGEFIEFDPFYPLVRVSDGPGGTHPFRWFGFRGHLAPALDWEVSPIVISEILLQRIPVYGGAYRWKHHAFGAIAP